MLRSQRRVYDGSGEVARTQGAEGISGRVKFLPLAWAGMPKTNFRKNSDSPFKNISIFSFMSLRRCDELFFVITEGMGLDIMDFVIPCLS
ncbi:MAG: hypothetical protein ABGX72_06200 [Methyloprofundus sp.]